MNDSNWENQFSTYDIDLIKAKASMETENKPSDEDVSVTLEPRAPEHEETKAAEPEHDDAISEPIENVYTEWSEVIASREKVKENKATYDRLLSRFSNKEPRVLKKEDVEKAVAQMDECIVSSHQLFDQDPAETSVDRRLARKRRIVTKQLSSATDAFITAKYIGTCFVDIDQADYYKYLDDKRYVLMTSQASRTFHSNLAKIFEGSTAQQSKDAIDKITASAERLAMTLAEIINFFVGENGMTVLLGKMVDKADENEIESFGRTMQMAAKQNL